LGLWQRFRAEVEGNYRNNEIDSIRGLGLSPVARTGASSAPMV
jgi:hypothetical protein